MKKRLLRLMLFCLLALVLAAPVSADMGPKPSVVVHFQGVEPDQRYYVTLLSEEESTGPWNCSYLEEPSTDADIWNKFVSYKDPDGFHFLEFFADCTGSKQFIWGYYPPQRFKVLLYFPDSDQFAVSQTVCEQYAFDSYFDATLQSGGTLTVEATYMPIWQGMAFLARLILTIAIEMLLAAVFGIFGRRLLVVLGVNIVTQVLLNLCLLRGGYEPLFVFYVLRYFLLELGVLAVEAVAYCAILPKLPGKALSRPRLVGYAVTANLASFVLGYWISLLAPHLF